MDAATEATKAASSTEEKAQEENQEVRHGEKELSELRRTCKNGLFAVARILSQGDLQPKTFLVLVLCSPLFTAHSEHAADARAPADVLRYYLSASLMSFLTPIDVLFQVLARSTDLVHDMV